MCGTKTMSRDYCMLNAKLNVDMLHYAASAFCMLMIYSIYQKNENETFYFIALLGILFRAVGVFEQLFLCRDCCNVCLLKWSV